MAIEHQGAVGQGRRGDEPLALQVAVDEDLDAGIGRAQVAAEQAALLAVVGEQVLGHRQQVPFRLLRRDLRAKGGELEADVADQLGPVAGQVAAAVIEAKGAGGIHMLVAW